MRHRRHLLGPIALFSALLLSLAAGCITSVDEPAADSGKKETSTATDGKSVADNSGSKGSSTSSPSGNTQSGNTQSGSKTSPGAKSDDPAPKKAGLEPFDPPSLADLNAKAQWIDQPVKDSLKLLRERQAQEKPLATVAEALTLKNTTAENNAKILSAMGRLPKDDAEVDWDASINRHSRADVKSTNPILASSTAEFDISGLVGYGLFGFDWNFDHFAAADTVVKWQTSQDRMYDKVILRNDATWSDGKPITAHDIAFSYKTIMNPLVPVPAQRTGTEKLRWVHAYDDHTVVFFHREPLATNHLNMSFSIIPRHIYEKSVDDDPTLQNSEHHIKHENNPVSGGAYVISKRVRGQEIVLTRREDWYMKNGKQIRDKPYFKEIRFRVIEDNNTALLAVKRGEIDEMILIPEQWMTRTTDDDFYKLNTKAHGLEWVYFYFGWNLKTPYFSDVRVRKAMSLAFNHKEMLETLNYGLYEPANGIFHRTAWMAPRNPKPPYTQNLDAAEKLLDEAGWKDHDGDGIRDKQIDGKLVKFEFTILCMSVPDRLAYCTLLKENLDQIGVVCNVRPTEFTVLQDKMMKKEYQACFAGWGTGTDPDTAANLWKTGEERNYGSYSNPEVDKLFEQGRKEFDKEKRAAIYARIHELTYEDQPYTWLYFRNSFYAFNKNLRGYNFSARGPYHYGPGFGSIWKPKNP